jgi:hypothetical protein
MSGLFVNLCHKMQIRLRKSARDIDFFQTSAETGERNFLTLDDIESIRPILKDYIE